VRTNPFSDAWAFLTGTSSFHDEAGFQGIFMVPLFWALLLASFYIAWRNWSEDPEQRTTEHLVTWFFRVMIGVMWFEGSVWKLPLPLSGGFPYWVDQMKVHAAFDAHRWIVENVYQVQPILTLMNIGVFFVEVALAASLMLGFGVRLFGLIGMAFAFHLYLGLYRHPAEWPWLFFFLIFVHGFFVMHAAGRSLGLDALLRRSGGGLWSSKGTVGELYRRAS
jgi:hypothetical protein